MPAVRIGSVIGRGGDVIRRIRTATQARIKVAEGRPGTNQVVFLLAPEGFVVPASAGALVRQASTPLTGRVEVWTVFKAVHACMLGQRRVCSRYGMDRARVSLLSTLRCYLLCL